MKNSGEKPVPVREMQAFPQTGPGLPVMRYMFRALCLVVAAVSGGLLWRMRRREKLE